MRWSRLLFLGNILLFISNSFQYLKNNAGQMETGSHFLPASTLYTKLHESILFKHTLACNSMLIDLSSALLVSGYMFYYNESFLLASSVAQLSCMCRMRSPRPWFTGERISFRSCSQGSLPCISFTRKKIISLFGRHREKIFFHLMSFEDTERL